MRLLSGIKSAYKKTEARMAIQDILKNHIKLDMPDQEVETLATTLVESVWRKYPDLFDGSFGQRPHHIAVVAAALANAAGSLTPRTKIWNAVVAALRYVLSEIEDNGDLYPFNGIDHRLLETASRSYGAITREPSGSTAEVTNAAREEYPTFESWYEVFRRVAGEINHHLRDHGKGSLIDSMDLSPLREGWRDKVKPEEVATQFAQQFDITTFGR